MTPLEELWEQLGRVRLLSFVAQSRSDTGWTGKGTGTVEVRQAADGTMTFHEQGTWRPDSGRDLRFGNVYRWTPAGEVVRLEHLRFGPDNPVYLFDLRQAAEREWRSTSPHLCREDCYSAVLLLRVADMLLRWSIDGPRKREVIEYVYTGQDALA